MDKPLHSIGVVGAVRMNRVASFRLDPRAARTDADYYDVVADDSGTRPAPHTAHFHRAGGRRQCAAHPSSGGLT